jgi:hypothetical protein
MPSQGKLATSLFRKPPIRSLGRQTVTAQARNRERLAQERDVFEKRCEVSIGAKGEVEVVEVYTYVSCLLVLFYSVILLSSAASPRLPSRFPSGLRSESPGSMMRVVRFRSIRSGSHFVFLIPWKKAP